jgi:ATP-dependent Zn protease
MKRLVMALLIWWLPALALADTERLSYSTFIDYVGQGIVKSVNIYDVGDVEIQAVIVEDNQDKTALVDDPLGPKNDVLLHKFLKENGVAVKILGQDYKGDGRRSMRSEMFLGMWLVFGAPLLLWILSLVLLIVILFRLQSLRCSIEKLAQKN